MKDRDIELRLIPFGYKQDEEAEYNDFLHDLQTVLSTANGKRVINRFLKACDIYSISTTYSNQQDAFKNGMKNIGLQLFHAIMDIDNGVTHTEMLSEYWKQFQRRKNG